MDKFAQVLCPRCNRPPQNSLVMNTVFTCFICYETCGNIFWTQRLCPKPSCSVQNYTMLTSKPKTGQLIKCSKCKYECFYFRCPVKDCRKIMVKEGSKYRMGWATQCQDCGTQFKLVVCSCGGEIYFEAQQIIGQGATQYKCPECKKNVCYVTCPEIDCLKPTYLPQKIEIGERIKCNECKLIRYFVPCPTCGHSISCKNFTMGEKQCCNYCGSQFEYIQCPNGCGLNGYMGDDFKSVFRKCNRNCGIGFILLHCQKCKYPLYVEDYQFGFWREDQCPACKSQIKFHLCQCGLLNINQKKCKNPKCPVPTSCKNYTKQQRQLMKQRLATQTQQQQGGDYNEKQCKLCYDEDSCMVNQVCRHMMMCQMCYRNIRIREGQTSRCPICKTPGRYHKFVQPILQ